MKFKAVRTSLAAVLTVGLLISLLPLAYAVPTGPQGASAAKTRRGKNGDPASKNADTSDSSTGQRSDQESQSENSTSEASKSGTDQAGTQTSSNSGSRASQTVEQRVNTSPDQGAAPQARTTASQDSYPRPQQREAPAFDRPPLSTRGQPSRDSSVRPSSDPQSRPAPTYPDASSRGDSRSQRSATSQPTTSTGQRDRFPDYSTSGNTDPGRSDRSTGGPPVLHRPADSRNGGTGDGETSKPPVLRRPTDSPSRDGSTSDGNAGRPPRSGQQQGETGQPSGGEDEVIKLESTLVNLPILVSDRSGRYIPQLSERDFLLYEDGVQQKIASFGTEEVPFSVVLLLDVSPSVQGNIQDIQDAAIAFVRQLRDQDRVMVVSFDRQIHYLSDFTNDRRQLEWAIRRADTGSGTSIYDAVYETVQRKLRNIDGRKALILFSDGEDTTSGHASYDDAVHLVTESDVLVYGLRYPGSGGRGGIRVDPWPRNPIPGIQLPIPFPWPFPRRRRGPFRLTDPSTATSPDPQSWPRRHGGGGGDFMADITAAGGGPVYDAERIGDLSRVAYRIAEELRHVYVISYYPTNPLSNGGYRSVRVTVKNRDDIAVRHRRGYNAKSNGGSRPTT